MWFGLGVPPHTGRPSPARLEILRTYESSAGRNRPGASPVPSRPFETELDIEWRREYFEEGGM